MPLQQQEGRVWMNGGVNVSRNPSFAHFVDGVISDLEHLSSGVPQGSILAPLLFICYMNDLPNFTGELDTYLYADDTALLTRGNTIECINASLQTNFNNVLNCFAINKLALKANKTKVVLFCSHVEKVCKNVSQGTRMLWKMRSFISQNLAKYLYQTLIIPIFTYCDFIYDSTSQCNKNQIQVSQYAAFRAIKRCPFDFPTERLHTELEIDTLAISRQKSTLKMVFRGLVNSGPPELNSLFEAYVPSRSLRSESQLLILSPKTNLQFKEWDIAIRGCIYWNQVPFETKQCTSIEQFKTKLKKQGTEAIT